MRTKFLNNLARLAEKRAGLMLIILLIITVIAAAVSENLRLEMHFRNLMPQTHPMVKEFNRIIEDYSTASMIIVAATGEEQELKQFAEDLAPRLNTISEHIQRVDYKIEKDFFLKHGFMLQKVKDLKNSKDIYTDLSLLPLLSNINDNFEKTYVYDDESISNKEKENNAIRFMDGIRYFINTMDNYIATDSPDPEASRLAVDRFLLGDEYLISQEKDMILMMAEPNFTIDDVELVISVENKVDSLIHATAAPYPSIFAGTTGTMALARDETVAASSDMYSTSIIAFLLIIALFILSFRMWVAPLLAGISLITGVIWTSGFTAVTLGSLNIFTSMFAVILIGLGVDFSIHIISVYTENRAAGRQIGEALQLALNKSGSGIITGGITTASAFFTLMVSESAGMAEFGQVAGSGVLFCMIATLLVLPALLSFRDRVLIKIKKDKHIARSTEFHFLGNLAEKISRRPKSFLLAGTAATAVLVWLALQITFDYNYLNMEPENLVSIDLQHQMEEKFDVTPDFAVITTHSVEEARKISEAAKDLKMIGMVSSISDYIPGPQEQNERIPLIEEIKQSLQSQKSVDDFSPGKVGSLTEELLRLEANIVELAQLSFMGGQDRVDDMCKSIVGDLDDSVRQNLVSDLVRQIESDPLHAAARLNSFQSDYEPYLRAQALKMTSTETITPEMLPPSILEQFVSHDGKKYLVTVYPKESVWNLQFLERFTEQMARIDPRVTGIPNIFYVLIDIVGKDGRTAAVLTILVVFLLLLWDFKNLKLALIAMIPLVVGAFWMLGFMKMFGLQLTIVNIMGLPLILGIGIDDGVHIIHRYKIEGAGRIKTVFTSTGKAVLLTTLTTMLAFGSLYFSVYRGLGSLGMALFIGVGACFLTSVLFLPALLKLTEKKGK